MHPEGKLSDAVLPNAEVDAMPELIGFGYNIELESVELVLVFITILASLAIMVALGAWWQR